MRILLAGIVLSLVPVLAWSQGCPELAVHERVQLSAVHDGDTLRLTDGRRVRLLAINAPELAIDGKAEQPFARASRQAVEAFFADTDRAHLSYESRRTDRYGRLLAHVTHPSGRNLESHLVQQGLAVPVPVPPDLAFGACLEQLAAEAQRAGRGLWQSDYWQPQPATDLADIEAEFRVLCGQVSQVDRQSDLWIELAGDLVIKIAKADLDYFVGSDFAPQQSASWSGRYLQVAGWLQDRRDNERLMKRGFKPWQVQARSPYAMQWVDAQSCQ